MTLKEQLTRSITAAVLVVFVSRALDFTIQVVRQRISRS